MGREMALEAYRLGAEVAVVHGGDSIPCVQNVAAGSAMEMREAVHRIFRDEGADIYVSAAAISDFSPERVEGKIRSGRPVTLRLEPLPKLLDEVLSGYRPVTIAFKLGRDEDAAAQGMLDRGVAVVVVNGPEAMGAAGSGATILTAAGGTAAGGSKEEVAAAVWKALP
jgi:phosphopantothenoylcysteine decarboxylase/phosphopantothenate--cysteine ligase